MDTITPFARFGSARPRNSASRFAGVTRIDESVCVQRSPPIVIAIPKIPPSDEIATALPMTKNSSDWVFANRPMYAKKRIWKIGPPSIVGTYIVQWIQLKSARYAR